MIQLESSDKLPSLATYFCIPQGFDSLRRIRGIAAVSKIAQNMG